MTTKPVDPRRAGTRRVTLTPDDPTINQSEERPRAGHVPPTPNPPLKVTIRASEQCLPGLLARSCAKRGIFLHHNPVPVERLDCSQTSGRKLVQYQQQTLQGSQHGHLGFISEAKSVQPTSSQPPSPARAKVWKEKRCPR